MKFIKNLIAVVAIYSIAVFAAKADSLSRAISAATATSLLTNAQNRINNFVWINTSTGAATVYFYDSATTTTNYVVSASTIYSQATGWETNFSTNSSGIVITNLQKVITATATAVAAATNEKPRIFQFIVPGSQSLTVTDVGLVPLTGLTVYSTAAGTINITYDPL